MVDVVCDIMIGGAGLAGLYYHNIDSIKKVYKVDKR